MNHFVRRLWMGLVASALAVTLVAGASADGEKPPEGPVKRVIHALELATSSKADFTGSITLKIASGHQGPPLTYHWGGRCKGSKLGTSRLELLMQAMKEGYAVEVPSEPMEYKDRIYMCMTSIRILTP
jgi:hypothetical protein